METNLDAIDVIEGYVKEYRRALEPSSCAKVQFDPLVKLVSFYYMQSDTPFIVGDDGSFLPVKQLLNLNKRALTLTYLSSLLDATWVGLANKKSGPSVIQNGVLYTDLSKVNEKELKKGVCACIKKHKDALHIKDVGGNPFAILTAPVLLPEVYDKIVTEANQLGYSVNELLQVTGTGLTFPDVQATYNATRKICLDLGDKVLEYSPKNDGFQCTDRHVGEVVAF